MRTRVRPLALVAVFASVVCAASAAEAGRVSVRGDRPLPVQAEKVSLGRIGRSVHATGTVYPRSEVKLMAQAEGQVLEVQVREGDHVLKGQVLATLDSTVRRIEVALAESELAAARARLQKLQAGNLPQEIAAAEAEVNQVRASLLRSKAEVEAAQAKLKEAEVNAKSVESLHKTGVISNQEWLKVYTEANRSRADVEAGRARLEEDTARLRAAEERLKLVKIGARPEDIAAAKAEVEKALQKVRMLWVQLEYFQIRSPIAGVITERRVEPGDLANVRSHLFSLAQVKVLRVRSLVSELDLPRLRPGQEVQVEVDALPGRIFRGKLSHIYPNVDPHTRQGVAEVELPNPDLAVRPGYHVRLAFAPRLGREAVIMPAHAVEFGDNDEDKEGYVFVLGPAPKRAAKADKKKTSSSLDEGSNEAFAQGVPHPKSGGKKKAALFTAVRRKVRLGQIVDGKVEVIEGVKPGERVIVSAISELKEGQLVRVVAE